MNLAKLRERLEKASGPEREIDAALWLLAFEPKSQKLNVAFHTEYYDNYVSREALECDLGMMWVDQMDPPLARYSASIEYAQQLLRRGSRLRQRVRVMADPGGKGVASVYDDQDRDVITVCAATPALALCLAFVKAMEAQSNEPPQPKDEQRKQPSRRSLLMWSRNKRCRISRRGLRIHQPNE